jgi:hypothetical protein
MQLSGYIPREGRGVQVLASLAPSSQIVGSSLRTPGRQSRREKFKKKQTLPWKVLQKNGYTHVAK